MLRLGEKFAFERTRKDPKVLRYLPEVQAVLLNVDRGGFEEAVIRMLILMAESARDRPARPARALGQGARPRRAVRLARIGEAGGPHPRAVADRRVRARARARELCPTCLPDPAERQRAIEVVEFIAGAIEEMEPATIQLVQRFHSVLGLKGLALPARAPGSADGERDGARRARRGRPRWTPSRRSRPRPWPRTDPRVRACGEAQGTRPRARSGGIAAQTARRVQRRALLSVEGGDALLRDDARWISLGAR